MGNSQGSNDQKKRSSSVSPSAITNKERSEVTRTWAILQKNLASNGEELFINFFTDYPEYKELFPSLSDVPASRLGGNQELCKHAVAVTSHLTTIVENLKDLETIADELQILGRTHAEVTVTEQAFYDLLEVFLQLLHTKLGDKFSSVAREAWIKTFNTVYTYVFRGVAEHRDLEKCKKIAMAMLSGKPSEHLMPVHKKSVLKTTSFKVMEPATTQGSLGAASRTNTVPRVHTQELTPETEAQDITEPKERQNVQANTRANFGPNTLSKGAANLLAKGTPNPQSNAAANTSTRTQATPQTYTPTRMQATPQTNSPQRSQLNVSQDRRTYDTTRTPKNSIVEKKNSIVDKKKD